MAGVGKALSMRALLVAAAALLATVTGCAAQVVDEPGADDLDYDEAESLLVDGTEVGPGKLASVDAPTEDPDEVEDPEPHPWIPNAGERERTNDDPEPHPWHSSGSQGSPTSSEGGSHK